MCTFISESFRDSCLLTGWRHLAFSLATAPAPRSLGLFNPLQFHPQYYLRLLDQQPFDHFNLVTVLLGYYTVVGYLQKLNNDTFFPSTLLTSGNLSFSKSTPASATYRLPRAQTYLHRCQIPARDWGGARGSSSRIGPLQHIGMEVASS
ncbi:hypothetical protein BDZ89DRAFT_796204 [Hymenopellis radicata]|nr:hypothetical protein BDZ89DRAFT_796204 [Hymenopellis radicata]